MMTKASINHDWLFSAIKDPTLDKMHKWAHNDYIKNCKAVTLAGEKRERAIAKARAETVRDATESAGGGQKGTRLSLKMTWLPLGSTRWRSGCQPTCA